MTLLDVSAMLLLDDLLLELLAVRRRHGDGDGKVYRVWAREKVDRARDDGGRAKRNGRGDGIRRL